LTTAELNHGLKSEAVKPHCLAPTLLLIQIQLIADEP
jgi:hypothetical protein